MSAIEECRRFVAVLEEEARQLERWADETERGGWSTQHVKAMRDRAAALWAMVGRWHGFSGGVF